MQIILNYNTAEGVIMEESVEDIAIEIVELYKPKDEEVDWKKLLEFMNNKMGTKRTVFPDDAKRKILARLREGYTKEHLMTAIINVANDDYHKETKFKYATPQYFGRANTLEMHGMESNVPKNNKPRLRLDK